MQGDLDLIQGFEICHHPWLSTSVECWPLDTRYAVNCSNPQMAEVEDGNEFVCLRWDMTLII